MYRSYKSSSYSIMNSAVEDLNDSQYEALKQFKRNVYDVLPSYFTEVWLMKWLKAYKFNLKKTERVFRGFIDTRTVYELDSIADNYVKPEVASKYEFTCSLGIAKNGTPIRYTRIGAGDLTGFIMSLCGYEVVLYCSYLIETDLSIMRKENERTGADVSEMTYVVDLDKLSILQMMDKSVLETAMDLLQMLQDYYPEIWGNILIINAPSYFDKIFNLVKPIIRLNMIQKIRVASRDSTPPLLLKYIDEDVLPAFLGGKRVDSNGSPNCSEFVKFGGKIPEEYYLCNRTHLLASDPGAMCLWVSVKSIFNYAVIIRDAPSKIHVEIRTENGSIGLKMLFRELGEDQENIDLPACDDNLDENDDRCNVRFVSPPSRMQSHITPVDVRVNAPWNGIYIFRFDNSYSWFTSKKIIFRIQEMDKDDS